MRKRGTKHGEPTFTSLDDVRLARAMDTLRRAHKVDHIISLAMSDVTAPSALARTRSISEAHLVWEEALLLRHEWDTWVRLALRLDYAQCNQIDSPDGNAACAILDYVNGEDLGRLSAYLHTAEGTTTSLLIRNAVLAMAELALQAGLDEAPSLPTFDDDISQFDQSAGPALGGGTSHPDVLGGRRNSGSTPLPTKEGAK